MKKEGKLKNIEAKQNCFFFLLLLLRNNYDVVYFSHVIEKLFNVILYVLVYYDYGSCFPSQFMSIFQRCYILYEVTFIFDGLTSRICFSFFHFALCIFTLFGVCFIFPFFYFLAFVHDTK